MCAIVVHIFDMPVTLDHPKAQKRERLVARVSCEDKAIISQAAAIAGQSVGSFVLAEARKAAVQTLETRQRILLSAAQSRRLVEALLAPPRPPTERMQRALKLYRKTVISDVNVERAPVQVQPVSNSRTISGMGKNSRPPFSGWKPNSR